MINLNKLPKQERSVIFFFAIMDAPRLMPHREVAQRTRLPLSYVKYVLRKLFGDEKLAFEVKEALNRLESGA